MKPSLYGACAVAVGARHSSGAAFGGGAIAPDRAAVAPHRSGGPTTSSPSAGPLTLGHDAYAFGRDRDHVEPPLELPHALNGLSIRGVMEPICCLREQSLRID